MPELFDYHVLYGAFLAVSQFDFDSSASRKHTLPAGRLRRVLSGTRAGICRSRGRVGVQATSQTHGDWPQVSGATGTAFNRPCDA